MNFFFTGVQYHSPMMLAWKAINPGLGPGGPGIESPVSLAQTPAAYNRAFKILPIGNLQTCLSVKGNLSIIENFFSFLISFWDLHHSLYIMTITKNTTLQMYKSKKTVSIWGHAFVKA